MMARIGLLLTRTPWYDQRQYHHQGPALLEAGHDVVYIADLTPNDDYPYSFTVLSARQRERAAWTGGLNLLLKVMRCHLDVLQLSSVEQLPLGIVITLMSRLPFWLMPTWLPKVVYDCREDMPSSFRDHKTWLPRPVAIALSWATRLLEGIGARLFDGLVTADPATAELHPHAKHKLVFYNVAPVAHFKDGGPDLVQRDYDLIMFGSMTREKGFLDIINAVGLLRDRGVRVKMLGVGYPADYTFEREMTALIVELDLAQQFEWRGRVDHLDVPAILYNTRIGIVPWHDYLKLRRNIPNKAFEFMAARMAIVATGLSSQRRFLRHRENALFYQPGDTEALAKALAFLLRNRNSAQRLADRARRDFLDTWNLERLAVDYTRFYGRFTRPWMQPVNSEVMLDY